MNRQANSSVRVLAIAVSFLLWHGALSFAAEQLNEAQLPPPAETIVDFSRDIRPILENSCLNCHGPQKPKGKFRLTQREAALKGGVNGVAILPGQSAKSPLILMVAGLVPDAEMPPPGKGEPLTDEQIGLLRAWIDQGAAWDDSAPTNEFSLTLTPVLGWTSVQGDERKFREHHWQREGINGGGEFEVLSRTGPETTLSLAGYARVDDYRANLSLDKVDVGFIRTGWEQYRKYYDDTGGYRPSPSTPAALSLNRDLHLDIGRAWIDFGLTLPDWPRIVLGYEYDYRRGNEAGTGWGGTGTGTDARNMAPVSKSVDEGVHIIKFDLDAELGGVAVEERFRGEFYRLDTHYTNSAARGPVSQNVQEHNSYFQGANTIRLEKPVKEWWLVSAGYLYSQLNGDATFTDSARYLSIVRVATVPQITVHRESHVFNANSLFGPLAGLTLTAGVQSEWTRENGVGGGILHRIPFTYSVPLNLATNPASLFADRDENITTEHIALRYAAIPSTTLFAEARLQQESLGTSDSEFQPSGGNFVENVDATRRSSDARFGFNTSPWRTVMLSSHYRHLDDDSEYLNESAPQPVGTYPGFISARNLISDEVEVKLSLRPARWLKTTFGYQYLRTDSWTTTRAASNTVPAVQYSPGGSILAGKFDSHVYSLGTTVTPCNRLFFDAIFAYQQSFTRTADNEVAAVAPYRGDIYSLFVNGTYVLSESTDLFAGYSFAAADFEQRDNALAGLPVGIRYTQHGAQLGIRRRISRNVTAQLQGGYYNYDEPTSGGANNYVACSVFGAITLRLP